MEIEMLPAEESEYMQFLRDQQKRIIKEWGASIHKPRYAECSKYRVEMDQRLRRMLKTVNDLLVKEAAMQPMVHAVVTDNCPQGGDRE